MVNLPEAVSRVLLEAAAVKMLKYEDNLQNRWRPWGKKSHEKMPSLADTVALETTQQIVISIYNLHDIRQDTIRARGGITLVLHYVQKQQV